MPKDMKEEAKQAKHKILFLLSPKLFFANTSSVERYKEILLYKYIVSVMINRQMYKYIEESETERSTFYITAYSAKYSFRYKKSDKELLFQKTSYKNIFFI